MELQTANRSQSHRREDPQTRLPHAHRRDRSAAAACFAERTWTGGMYVGRG